MDHTKWGVRERLIELGESIGDRQVEIKSGVEPDQRVVLDPLKYSLGPGDRVQAQ